jgi:acyl carrier protein
MNAHDIAGKIETYVRETFQIAPDDPGFGRSVDLFEAGYVDSVGVIELLAFVSDEFVVEVPDSALLSERFATIDGMAEIILALVAAKGSPTYAIAARQGCLVEATEPGQ